MCNNENKPKTDLKNKPKMVNWLEPRVLWSVLKAKIISQYFGKFADHRLTSGMYDSTQNCNEHLNLPFYNFSNDGDEIWVDYVADTGDGFDSTYTVAYCLAQNELAVENLEEDLPRGNILIFGGDQVYPDASRENYENRFEDPYSEAFPDPAPDKDSNLDMHSTKKDHPFFYSRKP